MDEGARKTASVRQAEWRRRRRERVAEGADRLLKIARDLERYGSKEEAISLRALREHGAELRLLADVLGGPVN